MISPYAFVGMVGLNIPPVTWGISSIAFRVCRHYGVSTEDIRKRSRYRHLVEPRQVVCYLARERTKLSLKSIAEYFGQDHTTVIHSLQQIQNLIDTNTITTDQLNNILNQ